MKKLIIGLVLGMMIGISAVSFAAVEDLVGTEVKAVFAQFNLKINGADKKLETAPLVYNGTSYLPVRDVANLVGYDVTYKADSRTIEMNYRPAPSTVSSATYAPEPPVRNDTVDSSIWVSLRELSEKHGLKATYLPETLQLKVNYENQSLTFNMPNNTTGENTIMNDAGNITMLIRDGGTYLNRSDLNDLGLPN